MTVRSAEGDLITTPLSDLPADVVSSGDAVRYIRAFKGKPAYSGHYYAATTASHLAFESLLERDRLVVADADRSVARILSQPFRLSAEYDGRRRSHVPDLLLGHTDGRVTVVDVKPAHRVDTEKVRPLLEMTRAAVRGRGWAYEVWSGGDPVRMANLRWLSGYRRPFLFDQQALAQAGALVTSAAQAAGGRPVGLGRVIADAASLVSGEVLLPLLLHLLWRGELSADMDLPLSMATVLDGPR